VSPKQSPIVIRQIDHVVLRTTELEKMLAFYCGVLGCTVERRQDEVGLVQLRAGSSLIDLVPLDRPLGAMGGAPPGREGKNMDHFCLSLESFDEKSLSAYLAEHGIPAGEVAPRFGADGLGPSMYLVDPQGNTVELKGPPW
jgi:glyoxylase I family protein